MAGCFGVQASESFKISNTKTEYMNCNFCGDVQRDVTPKELKLKKYDKESPDTLAL